jgi:membrane protein
MKNVGGQALIEGIMMKSPELKSISIRKHTGEIITTTKKLKENPVKDIPVIRGIYSLITSVIEGSEDINYSASFFEDEDDKQSKFELFLEKYIKIENFMSIISFTLAIFLAIFMFLFIPATVAKFFEKDSGILFSLIEGFIKISIFVSYIAIISKLPDMKKVFMYHGAEHKSIFAYEKGLELTVENIKKMPRLHPRCGTNFIAVTLIISILASSFIQVDSIIIRVFTKIIILPLIAGISYEVIKLAGKSGNILTNLLIFPGMMLQKITTQEPEDEQIEVAIVALKKVL